MRTVVAGVLERDGRVLVTARSSPAWAAGRWEFPGGRVQDGETPAAALTRLWREELGVEVGAGAEVYRSELDTPAGRFALVALRLSLLSADPRPMEHRALAWVAPPDLTQLNLLPGHLPVAAALTGLA